MDEPTMHWPGAWRAPREPVSPWRRWAGVLCGVAGFALLAYSLNDLQYPLRDRRISREEVRRLRPHRYQYIAGRELEAAQAAIRDATYRLRVDGMLALLGGIALTGGWMLAKSPRDESEDVAAD